MSDNNTENDNTFGLTKVGSAWEVLRAELKKVADCSVYLKEGETPAQCIARNRKDTSAVLRLLRKEKERTEELQSQVERLKKIACHIPAKIYIQAKESAGFGVKVIAQAGNRK